MYKPISEHIFTTLIASYCFCDKHPKPLLGLLEFSLSDSYPLGLFLGLSKPHLFFKNKFIYFNYLFLAALGLHCCTWAFSSCGEQGLLFVAVHGLLIVVASLVAEHGL